MRSTFSAVALETAFHHNSTTRFVPAIRDGRVHGYKVFAIEDGSWWAAAGFRPGDTIIEAFGQPVADVLDIALAVDAIGTHPIDFTVLRRACRVRLELSLDAAQ